MYEAYAISKHFYMQKPIERMNPTENFQQVCQLLLNKT